MANQTKETKNLSDSFISYLKSVKLEWGKITWPPKQQVIVETIYVIVIVFIFSVVILFFDFIYSGILKLLHLTH